MAKIFEKHFMDCFKPKMLIFKVWPGKICSGILATDLYEVLWNVTTLTLHSSLYSTLFPTFGMSWFCCSLQVFTCHVVHLCARSEKTVSSILLLRRKSLEDEKGPHVRNHHTSLNHTLDSVPDLWSAATKQSYWKFMNQEKKPRDVLPVLATCFKSSEKKGPLDWYMELLMLIKVVKWEL